MTTPTLEDQARCEAALSGGHYCSYHEWIEPKDHGCPNSELGSIEDLEPACWLDDITTAEGREAIVELIRPMLAPVQDGAWTAFTDEGGLTVRPTYAEAITGAWYEFVNRWKEQGDGQA